MEVILYNDTHLDAFLEFTQLAWNSDVTKNSMLRERDQDFQGNPYAKEGGGFPTAVITDCGRIIGHLKATPCRILIENHEHLMYWLSGLHVLPEYRGKGLAKLLVKKLTDHLPIVTGALVVEEARKAYKKCGWSFEGRIPEFAKITDAMGFFKKLRLEDMRNVPWILTTIKSTLSSVAENVSGVGFAFVMNKYEHMWKLFNRNDVGSCRVQVVDRFDDRVDGLWERNRHALQFAQVRKSAYLNWQFSRDSGWVKLVCDWNSDALGYAIVALKTFGGEGPLAGMKVVSVIDVFWDLDNPVIVNGILEYIDTMARESGAEVILASGTDRRARSVMVRNGFIKIPSTVYYGFHCSQNGLRLSTRLGDWFITRGDADAAGSLGPGT